MPRYSSVPAAALPARWALSLCQQRLGLYSSLIIFFFLYASISVSCKYPKYPVNICSFGLVFISSAFATLWPFGLKQVEGCAHQPLAVSPCFVFQRVMTSCTASPISQMLMRRRDDRNGTSWTSRLITAEWDSQALCGNSPQLTNTTRSLSWP